jgi:hypothetical protein
VRHKVSVDPVDDVGVDISHLEQRWNLWVSGTAIDPDHVSHAPGPFRVSDDHGHACFDVQEDGIGFGHRDAACMINRHTPAASTAVLVQEWVRKPGSESEDQIPTEISGPLLRMDKAAKPPIPPPPLCAENQLGGFQQYLLKLSAAPAQTTP